MNNKVIFANGSKFAPDLNGFNTAGTDYDQLVVGSSGNVTIVSGANLVPTVIYNPAPPPTCTC